MTMLLMKNYAVIASRFSTCVAIFFFHREAEGRGDI